MGTIINKKIIEFGAQHRLNIVAQRNRKFRIVHTYTVRTDNGTLLCRISPDCSYEQFLEKIAIKAISEAERLYNLTDEMEEENAELWEDFIALKEVTDEREDN